LTSIRLVYCSSSRTSRDADSNSFAPMRPVVLRGATKVTGVNYDKLVKKGDRIVQKPHFRMNGESPHIAECEWVLRERALDARDFRSLEGAQTTNTTRRARNHKSGDLVDVFSTQLNVSSSSAT